MKKADQKRRRYECIAELTNSSRTTIWRMMKKMGYRNFSEFHHELKRAVHQYTYYNRILPCERAVSAEKIQESLYSQCLGVCQSLTHKILITEIEVTAEAMERADKVVFYTPYKGFAILSLQQNLAMDKKETGYYCLSPDMLADSKLLSSKSIVFVDMIEHLETIDMKPVFENIKKSGAKIFGIERNK